MLQTDMLWPGCVSAPATLENNVQLRVQFQNLDELPC